MINKERLLNTFLEYIQIDSESYHEGAFAARVAADMQAIGCQVYQDSTQDKSGSEAGNLYCTLPGNTEGKAMIFSAHMDTVVPGKGIEPVIENGIIRSKGDTVLGGDDKSGIAAIVEAMRTIVEKNLPHPTIEAVFTVCEEIGLKGYDTFMREDPNNRNQYADSANIDTHKDITVTVLTNGFPGAAGDQCPVDLIRWVEPESDLDDPNCKRNNPPKRKADPSMFDLAGMRKTGKRIAREIIDLYEEGLDEAVSDVPFEHHVHSMQLPLRRVTMSEVAAARRAIREYLNDHPGDVDFNDAAHLQVHLGILRRAELQEVLEVLPTEVHVIRMGTVAFATNPFELFLDYGNQIKARSLAEQTFLVQLAVCAEGYLPTEKAEKGGHYSAFLSSGQVGHVGGEQLVRETLQDINGMFSK